MSLLTTQQLYDRFSKSNNFIEAYKTVDHKDGICNLLSYMIARFKLGGNRIHKNKAKGILLNKISKARGDSSIYHCCRDLQCNNMGCNLSVDTKKQIESNEYTKTIIDKVNYLNIEITKYCEKGLSGMRVLDIGTENLLFLDAIQKHTNVAAHGINIDDGFCHYEDTFKNNKNDSRFQIYDGVNIPFPDNSFDIITLYSVIHHIPDDGLVSLVKEIKRVCKGYIYIKDVDLTSQSIVSMCQIQHDLYEGVMVPGDKTYINSTVSIDKTTTVFKNEGFEVVSLDTIPNFNHTYYMLLHYKE